MEVNSCTSCRLAAYRRHTCPGRGDVPAPVMVIGIGPGREEDKQGQPWVGRSGQLLATLLGETGVGRVFLTNAVRCLLPGTPPRAPLPDEVEACSIWLQREIAQVNPSVILLLGGPAVALQIPGARLSRVSGVARYRDGRIWIPAPHPAAVLRGGRMEYLSMLRAAIARARVEVEANGAY